MKKFTSAINKNLLAICLGLISACVLEAAPRPGYRQINLVSDENGNALHSDGRLINPWGLAVWGEGIWVADNGTGESTVYNRGGHPYALTVNISALAGSTNPSTPTGIALNQTTAFVITNGNRHAPARFIYVTEDGTILAYNPDVDRQNAAIMVDNSGSGAIYKGVAIAGNTNATAVYAANFHTGAIDVYDDHFHFVKSFTDPNLPPGFAPFGIRRIHGKLFVTYAKQSATSGGDDEAGPGNGYIDIFDLDGTVLRQFAAQGALNSPWGLAVAPTHFGKFSHALLVGNFGDGRINAYDLITGQFLGALSDDKGVPIVISGLWGLSFEREPSGAFFDFEAARLFFTSGPGDESHGLFGYLQSNNPLGN